MMQKKKINNEEDSGNIFTTNKFNLKGIDEVQLIIMYAFQYFFTWKRCYQKLVLLLRKLHGLSHRA